MPAAAIADTIAACQTENCAQPMINVSGSLERDLAGRGQNQTLDRSGRSGGNQWNADWRPLGQLGRSVDELMRCRCSIRTLGLLVATAARVATMVSYLLTPNVYESSRVSSRYDWNQRCKSGKCVLFLDAGWSLECAIYREVFLDFALRDGEVVDYAWCTDFIYPHPSPALDLMLQRTEQNTRSSPPMHARQPCHRASHHRLSQVSRRGSATSIQNVKSQI